MAIVLYLAGLLLLPLAFTPEEAAQATPKAAFMFMSKDYFHRYTKENLHEFTPKDQPDLKKWTDMFTINDYPAVKDGDALAKAANSVLDTYDAKKAIVVRTDSVPRTEKKPAEHLIVVLFPQPDFIEAAFARFVLDNGKGVSMVYSHRIYGKKSGDAMSAWLKLNGEKCEKALMTIPSVPKH